MKAATAGMISDIAQGQTTFTAVLVLKRTDGVVICVTEHDENLVFTAGIRAVLQSRNFLHSIGHDVTALAYAGFSRFNLNDKDNLDTSNVQVQGMIDPSIFTRADIKAQRFDYSAFQVFMVNWMDLTHAEIVLSTGRTGTWTIEEYGFKANFYGLSKQLEDVGGELCGPSCRVDFGSPRCAPGGVLDDGTTIDSLMQTATVAATDGSRLLTAAAFNAGGVITAAVKNAAGTGYAPGDTGLIGGGNGDAAYVIDTVAGGGAVATFHLTANGTGYVSGTGVATGVTTGAGDGAFTVDITATTANGIQAANGVILTSVKNAAGSGYAPGDTGTIAGGNNDATYVIDTVSAGAVATYHLTSKGTGGYSTATGVATAATTGSGIGFTVDITASVSNGSPAAGKPLNGGLLTWLTGNNAGLSMEAKIVDPATGDITLYLPMFLTIQIGDTFRLLPACDKTIGTCAGAYHNAANNQSEPYKPGLDWELTSPDWHAPHP